MNPYDPTNENDPAERPRPVNGRRTVERYLMLPFYVTAAVLRDLGIEAELPGETRQASGLRVCGVIRERGLLPRFAEAIDAAWAKSGRA